MPQKESERTKIHQQLLKNITRRSLTLPNVSTYRWYGTYIILSSIQTYLQKWRSFPSSSVKVKNTKTDKEVERGEDWDREKVKSHLRVVSHYFSRWRMREWIFGVQSVKRKGLERRSRYCVTMDGLLSWSHLMRLFWEPKSNASYSSWCWIC